MRRLVAALGIMLAACGGNVTGSGSDPDPEGGQEQDASAPSTHPGHAEPSNADTELGECKLGPVVYEADASPCAWLAANRCYAARDMACNCVCPRDRDSQCTSGFEAGPDGRVVVDCY